MCNVIKSEYLVKKIDIGKVEFECKKERYFVSVMGVGFDAQVNIELGKKKKLGGTLPYIIGTFSTLSHYDCSWVNLKHDDLNEKLRVLMISIANGKYLGGGMKIAPNAKMDDGLLDVIIVGDVGYFETLRTFPKIYAGTHLTHKKVKSFNTKYLEISSCKDVFVHTDGDVVGKLPIKISLLEKILNVKSKSL